MISPLSVTVLTGVPGTNGVRSFQQIQNDVDGLRVTALVPWGGRKKTRSKSGVSLLQTTERFKRLGKGCACCTVRSDVMSKIRRIVDQQTADHVLIQIPPKSDLDALAKTFTVPDEEGLILADVARIESVVTVVDGRTLQSTLAAATARLLIERIEVADMILLEGTGDLASDTQHQIMSAINALNPQARIVRSTDGSVSLSSLRAQPRDEQRVDDAQTRGLNPLGSASNASQSSARFAYRERTPFHPGRLHELISQPWSGVLRVQGTFWVASRPDLVGTVDIAGNSSSTSCRGLWWATVPQEKRPATAAFKEYVDGIWHPDFGDRHQEIVVIGLGLDEPTLRRQLDACLLTEDELATPDNWSALPHPFPWPQASA